MTSSTAPSAGSPSRTSAAEPPTAPADGLHHARHAAERIGRYRFLHLIEVVLVDRQDAQPGCLRDGGCDHPGPAERERDDNDDRQHLLPQRMAVTEEHAIRAGGVDALVPEKAQQERAEDAADEVDRNDVERVVEAEKLLQPQRKMADQPGEPTDDDGGVRVDVPGRTA